MAYVGALDGSRATTCCGNINSPIWRMYLKHKHVNAYTEQHHQCCNTTHADPFMEATSESIQGATKSTQEKDILSNLTTTKVYENKQIKNARAGTTHPLLNAPFWPHGWYEDVHGSTVMMELVLVVISVAVGVVLAHTMNPWYVTE